MDFSVKEVYVSGFLPTFRVLCDPNDESTKECWSPVKADKKTDSLAEVLAAKVAQHTELIMEKEEKWCSWLYKDYIMGLSINAWSDNLILIKAQGVCERHNRIRLQCWPSAVFLKASNVNWQLYITHVLGSRISWIEMSCVFGHLHTRLTKTLTQVMLLHNLTLSFGIAEMKV